MSFSVSIYVIAAIDALFVVLSQTALWQRKEYRIDRMRAYMTSPERESLNSAFWYISGSLICVSLVGYMLGYDIVANGVGAVSIASILIGYVVRAFQSGVARPTVTVRSGAVAGISLIVLVVLLVASKEIAQIALLMFLSPIVIALAVALVSIPALMKKRHIIMRATNFRESLHDVVAVGITGSVGKTSTKKYLVHLLGGENDKIIATHEHRNSPYVVAQDMLLRLHTQTKTYIAEMGAYKKGEIRELANLVRPTIGVITAITNQHVALFGSLEELANTKWELVDSIPDGGTLVLNKDDAVIHERAKHTQKNIIWFSLEQDADISMKNILIEKDSTVCSLTIGGASQEVRLPTVSRGQLGSVLAAAATAHALGISDAEIFEKITTLPQLERTMQVRTGLHSATVTDDSYSASEASVRNAIDYLKNVSLKNSHLVLVPIIELGSEGMRVHERIGTLLKNLDSKVCIYGTAYKESILRGLGDEKHEHVTWYQDAKKLAHHISSQASSESLIVLEGRVPAIVREAVL